MLDYVINAKNVSCLYYWHYLQHFFYNFMSIVIANPHISAFKFHSPFIVTLGLL